MVEHILKPGKLLITVVGRHRSEAIVEVSKAAGARGGTISMGRSVEGSWFMQLLSLADVEQDIIFTLMSDETERVVDAIKQFTCENGKKYKGFGILLDVSGMLIRAPQGGANKAQETENKVKNSGYKLVNVIVNHGYADDVMVAARRAGATGGTVLTARGTGTADDVKFFGISLVPEKEMLMIVCEEAKMADIIAAVSATPNLSEPGGGIVYSMNVEEFIVLGKD